MSEVRSLVGVWRLRRYWTQYDDGPVLFPLGERASGYIVYTPDGFMSGTMQRAGVEPFTTPDRLAASVEEKSRAFDAYVTYCGRYRVESNIVWHSIELSLTPNWIGEEQTRRIVWQDDGLLQLIGEWCFGDRRRVAVVEWERT